MCGPAQCSQPSFHAAYALWLFSGAAFSATICLAASAAAHCSRLCSSEDAERSEDGAVKKCMIANYPELTTGCQHELGRSIHMSFFVWQPKGVVTAPCDADIQRFCLSKTQGMEVTPGAVAVCLSEMVSVALPSGTALWYEGSAGMRRPIVPTISGFCATQQSIAPYCESAF